MSANEVNNMEGVIGRMKVIQRIFPPSARHVGAGSRQQALDGPGSPGAAASLLLNKRLTIPLLVLLAGLAAALFLMPGGLLQADEHATTIEYAENGTDPLATFTATDPEGVTPVAWFIAAAGNDHDGDGPLAVTDAADADDFDISEEGVLTFDIGGDTDTPDDSVSPDFENPAGAGTPANNTYNVVVGACDVALDGGACPTTARAGYHGVTVMVTNEDETGTITLATDTAGGTPQYLVGAELTATAEDGDITATTQTFTADVDGEVNGVTWRWYRGSTEIDDADANTYTLVQADAGQHIRVVAYYIVAGNVDQEMAEETTDYPVLAAGLGSTSSRSNQLRSPGPSVRGTKVRTSAPR